MIIFLWVVLNNKRCQTDIKLRATSFHAGFLLGLFFGPEDGGDMFIRNVG
jgi:hypothetical protein